MQLKFYKVYDDKGAIMLQTSYAITKAVQESTSGFKAQKKLACDLDKLQKKHGGIKTLSLFKIKENKLMLTIFNNYSYGLFSENGDLVTELTKDVNQLTKNKDKYEEYFNYRLEDNSPKFYEKPTKPGIGISGILLGQEKMMKMVDNMSEYFDKRNVEMRQRPKILFVAIK